jgi:hypothetical protein
MDGAFGEGNDDEGDEEEEEETPDDLHNAAIGGKHPRDASCSSGYAVT